MEDNSKDEILHAINDFSTRVDERFDNVEKDVKELKGDVSGLKEDVSGLKKDVSGLKKDVSGLQSGLSRLEGTVNTQMVTKDYLDTKMSDLRGDLVVLTRKEDKKLQKVVEILKEKNIFSDEDLKKVFSMEPFANN